MCGINTSSKLKWYYQHIPTTVPPLFYLSLYLPSSLYVSHPLACPPSLPCHSTLLNCSSNGKDDSVEMERIEKRRGGNQWDNRQGRGPGQWGWPLHWSTHTQPTSTTVYSSHNHRPLSAPAPHSEVTQKMCVCVWWLCMPACGVYGAAGWRQWWWCRGYGDKLRCPVTSVWGKLGLVCRVPLEVICCCISDGLEMGLELEFMPPITERRERVSPNARRAQNIWHRCLTRCSW